MIQNIDAFLELNPKVSISTQIPSLFEYSSPEMKWPITHSSWLHFVEGGSALLCWEVSLTSDGLEKKYFDIKRPFDDDGSIDLAVSVAENISKTHQVALMNFTPQQIHEFAKKSFLIDQEGINQYIKDTLNVPSNDYIVLDNGVLIVHAVVYSQHIEEFIMGKTLRNSIRRATRQNLQFVQDIEYRAANNLYRTYQEEVRNKTRI